MVFPNLLKQIQTLLSDAFRCRNMNETLNYAFLLPEMELGAVNVKIVSAHNPTHHPAVQLQRDLAGGGQG